LKKLTLVDFNPLSFEKVLNNENGFPIAVQNCHAKKKKKKQPIDEVH
jgi:hypothetical protein